MPNSQADCHTWLPISKRRDCVPASGWHHFWSLRMRRSAESIPIGCCATITDGPSLPALIRNGSPKGCSPLILRIQKFWTTSSNSLRRLRKTGVLISLKPTICMPQLYPLPAIIRYTRTRVRSGLVWKQSATAAANRFSC